MGIEVKIFTKPFIRLFADITRTSYIKASQFTFDIFEPLFYDVLAGENLFNNEIKIKYSDYFYEKETKHRKVKVIRRGFHTLLARLFQITDNYLEH